MRRKNKSFSQRKLREDKSLREKLVRDLFIREKKVRNK